MNSKLFFFALLLILGLGCVNSEILPVDYPEPTVTASMIITINNINGEPVADAVVQIGEFVFLTNEFGICFVENITIPERPYITVEKSGYFNGSRRLYACDGQTQYAKITLLDKIEVGIFSSSSGGEISIDQTSSVVFPPHAIVTIEGAPYDGPVHISGAIIYGDDPELATKMPGILEGRNANRQRGVLSSYGMMAIEMRTPLGIELQVKDGLKVEMNIEVPASMRSGAPEEIPMWYFDEEKGEWQQEGNAHFNGTGYEARVSHFTLWNCDDWDQSVSWGARFVDESGRPLPNLQVCLRVLSSLAVSCDLTDSEGYISGNLPFGEVLRMEVTSSCGSLIYSKQIGPYTSISSLGTVTVEPSSSEFTSLSGIGHNCNGKPIKRGFAIVRQGADRYYAPINSLDGSFSLIFQNCISVDADVVVVDQTTNRQSIPVTIGHSATIDIGTIAACDVFDEYLTLRFEGFAQSYLFTQLSQHVNGGTTTIRVTDVIPGGYSFVFEFYCLVPGPCGATMLGDKKVFLPNGQIVFINTLNLNLLEYDNHVQGGIYGELSGGGNGQGGSGITNYTGTFSVKR